MREDSQFALEKGPVLSHWKVEYLQYGLPNYPALELVPFVIWEVNTAEKWGGNLPRQTDRQKEVSSCISSGVLKKPAPDMPVCVLLKCSNCIKSEMEKTKPGGKCLQSQHSGGGLEDFKFQPSWTWWNCLKINQKKKKKVNRLIFHCRMFLKCILPRFLTNLLRARTHIALKAVWKPLVERAAAQPPPRTALLKTPRTSECGTLPSFRNR